MHSTKTLPIIQEGFIENNKKCDIQSLVNDMSDSQCNAGVLMIQSGMPSFTQTSFVETVQIQQDVGTTKKPIKRTVTQYYIKGRINTYDNQILYCPICGNQLNKNGKGRCVTLQHATITGNPCRLEVNKQRYICSNKTCDYFFDEQIDFKAQDHFITTALEYHIIDLLKQGYTAKKISILTNVSKNTVRDIHFKYLKELYTENGEGKVLLRPKEQSRYLGIDEFLLHKGHKYATVIMDIETGHVLYLAHGKKKQVVYDFIEWIGMDWMKGVKAIACDMNSDFQEAFREKCPWLKICYDYFHIVKNFNDKVVSEVRKDIQKQLIADGEVEAAKALKGSKYVLMTTHETRQRKEQDAKDNKVIARGAELFNKAEKKQRAGIEKEYKELIEKNELLFVLDLVKETLKKAYTTPSERGMKIHINRIIRYCNETENEHFKWFARLLEKHMYGITTHATLQISSGKVEGFNNMIKTIRRQGFGYPDDDYFFLLIMDASRKDLHWS